MSENPTPTPNRGRWVKGQSGNPSGKSKFDRTLANLLRETGDKPAHENYPYKKYVASAIWRAAAYGETDMLSGRLLELDTQQWLDLVKWLNVHIDGVMYVRRTITDPDLQSDLEPVQADNSPDQSPPDVQPTLTALPDPLNPDAA